MCKIINDKIRYKSTNTIDFISINKIKEMKRVREYVLECYNELMHKVSWPTWSELQDSAIVVLVATLIFGFVVFLVDFIIQGSLKMVYDLFI